jgi:hypothetical protein
VAALEVRDDRPDDAAERGAFLRIGVSPALAANRAALLHVSVADPSPWSLLFLTYLPSQAVDGRRCIPGGGRRGRGRRGPGRALEVGQCWCVCVCVLEILPCIPATRGEHVFR